MQSGIREFCMINHQNEMLRDEKRSKTEVLVKNKKTAQDLLKEYIAESNQNTENTQYIVSIGEDQFRLELQQPKPTFGALGSSVCDEILSLWQDRSDDIAQVFRSPTDEPVAAVALFIEECLFASYEPKLRPASLKLTKYKARANVDPPLDAPPEWKSLVQNVIESKDALSAINKEHRAKKEEITKLQKSCEDKLVTELDALPPGSIQKVNLITSEGGSNDTYYVRVKPPRKLPKRKISCIFFKKALRGCIHDTLLCLDSHVPVSDVRVGTAICDMLRQQLEEKEIRLPDDELRRISLDKMRNTTKTRVE